MKKIVFFAIVFFLLITAAAQVMAQSPSPDPSDENGPSDVVLSPSGTVFKSPSADGQCATSGASCTTAAKTPGVCLDNGHGVGVCSSAVPSIDPLFETGCGPTDTCHIVGEKINAILKGGQDKTDNWFFDPVGTILNYAQDWLGQAKPNQAVYHYGTDLLAKFGTSIKQSTNNDLTPATLQKLTLHDYQPKRYCTTSRICITNAFDINDTFRQFISQEQWCTEDPPGRKELIEGTRQLDSMIGRHSLGTDLRLPNTVIKKSKPLACYTPLEDGRHIDNTALNFTKFNYFDAVTKWVVELVDSIVHGPFPCEKKDGKTQDCWMSDVPTDAKIYKTQENSFAASLAGISFTVTELDLKPFTYPLTEQARKDLTKGGVWDTYRNNAYAADFTTPLDAYYENQNWYVDIRGFRNQPADTTQTMNARQEYAQAFGMCSIINKDMQPGFFSGGECDKNWVGASTTNISTTNGSLPPSEPDTSTWASSPGGASANPISPRFTPPSPITAGNATALVPACVLEGVAQIEGAYEGGAPCKPNECGAYGPFQITIGKCTNQCHASSCPNAAQQLGVTKDQLCDFNSAAYQAARLLVGKAKYWGTPLSATASIQSQKLGIINGADSYYGAGIPVARLGGLSYGEWVYQHCDPTATVTHVDHKVGKYPGTPPK